ncbi:MAG TPA: sigma factor-like helix-turn-helix DNA-binding protein [Acidobacteriota bacterium]|nr:sigma factor-like helix-turn-helix DNA-binding protein [Acidobacteriota bacterium]
MNADSVDLRDTDVGPRVERILGHSGCRTVGQALSRGEDWRMGRPSYGPQSEQELQDAIARLQSLPRSVLQRLETMESLLDSSPEAVCLHLFRRRLGRWTTHEKVFNHQALLALRQAEVERIFPQAQSALETLHRLGDDARPARRFLPRHDLSQERRPCEAPSESLGRLIKAYPPDSFKHRFLQRHTEENWPLAERALFDFARTVLPLDRWCQELAGRFLPSWVYFRLIVPRSASMSLQRRSRRCGWDTFGEALGDSWRDLNGNHDQVGEKALQQAVIEMSAEGPGWPLSLSRVGREESFREAFYASLERLDPRRERILRWRLGVDGPRPLTLQRTAALDGTSAERVRQLELTAWQHLFEEEPWPQRVRGIVEEISGEQRWEVPLELVAQDAWMLGSGSPLCESFLTALLRKVLGKAWTVRRRSAGGRVLLVASLRRG